MPNNKKTKNKKHIYAKKGTQRKCMLKTCKSHKYKSIYGISKGGTIRCPNDY